MLSFRSLEAVKRPPPAAMQQVSPAGGIAPITLSIRPDEVSRHSLNRSNPSNKRAIFMA